MSDEKKIEEMLLRLPIVYDWCLYKEEIYVAQVNWEASQKAKRPMMDLSYCMTKAHNGVILKTVQWDKNKFKPCHLTSHWENKNTSNEHQKEAEARKV